MLIDELTQEIVCELLDYDRATGVLPWNWRTRKWFTSNRIWRSWNAKHAGKPAFTARDTHGYAHGSIFGKLYLAHRVIWLMQTGRWPEPEVDHRNRHRSDNRWSNLREATNLQNCWNRSWRGVDTSGFAGVHREWRTRTPSYLASITVNRRSIHLGTFHSYGAARAARHAAELQYGNAPP